MAENTRTALVTGANRGIGQQVVRELASKGFHVLLGSRSRKKGEEARKDLGDHLAERVEVVELDVADEDSIRSVSASLEERLDRLDVLVNNAGIYTDHGRSILNLPLDDLLVTLRTNTFGPLALSQALWPLLRKASPGRIINVSSGLGQLSEMEDETPAYAISKTALNAVTRQLSAAGRKDGVVVNSISPGWVRTDMGGENAARSVEEGAEVIIWLASEAPDDITGQFLRDRDQIPW